MQGRRRPIDETERSLPLEHILAEEFAALHGESIPISPDTAYEPDDILDVGGFSTALETVLLAEDARELNSALLRPPAPHGTPIQEICELVVDGQARLKAALRAHDAGPGDIEASEALLRTLICARLNDLLAQDLTAHACFESVIAALVKSGFVPVASDVDDDARKAANKKILDAAFLAYVATTSDRRLEAVMTSVRRKNHAALCLSGGGIRSASFALGIVQGLAQYDILPRFHYLSTVSGGGFTGGWLSAWMARSGARSVWAQLKGVPTAKLDDEPAPLRHVRTFSRYLNPQLGIMSADTWTLIASGLRNVLLMWVVMIPLMAAGLMVPRLFVSWPMTTIVEWSQMKLTVPGALVFWDTAIPGASVNLHVDPAKLGVLILVVATALIFMALVHIHRYLRPNALAADAVEVSGSALGAFHVWCLIPLVAGVALLSQVWELGWSMYSAPHLDGADITSLDWAQRIINMKPQWHAERHLPQYLLGAYGAVLGLTSWMVGVRTWYRRPLEGVVCAAAGFVAGYLAALVDDGLFGIRRWKHLPEFYATLAVPTFLLLAVVGTQIFVGVMSRRMADAEREAAARLNAWMLIVIVSWVSAFGLALYGPVQAQRLLDTPRDTVAFILGCALTGMVGAMIASRSRASSDSRSGAKSAVGRFVALLIAPAFAASIIVLVSSLNIKLIGIACGYTQWCPQDYPSGRYDLFDAKNAHLLTSADFAQPQLIILVGLLLLMTGLTLGRFIDTNRFSLHAIYSVRLVRTFLGASKAPGDRAPDAFTGFDSTDDMPVGDLWPARPNTAAPPDEGVGVGHPPLHVLNMALNVVSADRLATQERKAESFTVTPLHAGSRTVGYRRTSTPAGAPRTRLYGNEDRGISLGTAVAISGAAASPNAGYHSSPVMTFLMTLFNLRLGRWLGNPGPAGDRTYHHDEPEYGFISILNEMFGRTTDRNPYVYLSDGSHFENLGLYEMVLRRCHFIVVSDAGCDPEMHFDDLGGAIRKIRIDFGIPIEFDSEMEIYPRSQPESAGDGVYWAVGRIRYSAVDRDIRTAGGDQTSNEDGILLYLKPAFYGSEPRDVYNYARKEEAFPHESTSNQFYGEAQFESYRALGTHVIERLCAEEFETKRGGSVSSSRLNGWIDAQLGAATSPSSTSP